eukprot:scaffold3030_cov72-Cyclotella_meneghiniana.AAC.2
MRAVLHLRMFSHPYSGENKKEHSYYIAHDSGGLSERLSTITVDSTTSFFELRERIEEREVGGVMKRTTFFSEFVHFMQGCPNPLGYQDKESLTSYSIGLLKVIDNKHFATTSVEDITLLHESEESDPICNVVSDCDLLSSDLVLIPKTQIHPHTGRLADTM